MVDKNVEVPKPIKEKKEVPTPLDVESSVINASVSNAHLSQAGTGSESFDKDTERKSPATEPVPPPPLSDEDKKLKSMMETYADEYDGVFVPQSFPDSKAAVTNNLLFACYSEMRKLREIVEDVIKKEQGE